MWARIARFALTTWFCLGALALASRAEAQSCNGYPYTLTNGTTADATQVMANFNCAGLLGAANNWSLEQYFAASTSAHASINLAPGVVPSSPNNGDLWVTSAGIFGQAGGQTFNLSSPSIPANVTVTSATDAAVRAAFTTAAANPTIAYIINLPPSPITLSSSLPALANVTVNCVRPAIQNPSGGVSIVDAWQFVGGTGNGTYFIGNGTFDAFTANTATVPSPTQVQFQNSYIVGFNLQHCGFQNFRWGLNIGGTGNAGIVFSNLTDLYFQTMTNGAWQLTNASNIHVDNIRIASNGVQSLFCAVMRSDVQLATFEPSNSWYADIRCNTGYTAGLWEDATTGSYLNQDTIYVFQDDGPAVSGNTLSVTPTTSSSAWPVTNLAYFQPGTRFYPSTSANGLNANETYMVQTASGATGSGTVTIGACAAAYSAYCTALTSTGSTAQTWNTEGPPAVRLGGSGGTVADGTYLQLDLENNSGVYIESGLQDNFDFAILSGSSPVVDRAGSIGNSFNFRNSAVVTDLTGANDRCFGSLGVLVQSPCEGVMYDTVRSMGTLTLGTVAHYGQGSDIDQRDSAFLYPEGGMGERVYNTGGSGYTLGGYMCGYDINSDSLNVSLTLPAIGDPTSNSTLTNSYQGCHAHWYNAEPVTLTFATSSSQLFNQVSGLTSLTVPAYAGLDLTGANIGSTLYWGAEWVNLVGRPTYDLNALPTPAVPTSGGTVTIADGTSYEGLQPTSALSSLTIALPNCSTTYATHKVEFRNESAFTISSISYTATTGGHGADLPTSLTSGQGFTARCEANAVTPGWY